MSEQTAPEATGTAPAAFIDWDTFLAEHVAGKSDRQLIVATLYGQHKLAVAVAKLHALVERIETEANETIGSLGSPEGMAEAARRFLGGA